MTSPAKTVKTKQKKVKILCNDILMHHCITNCTSKRTLTSKQYSVFSFGQCSDHLSDVLLLHKENLSQSDSRNFVCTQGTASTFTREHIMSSSAHRSLDCLTSRWAQTHICPHLTLDCILLSASWKATQLFAKHRDNKGVLSLFSLSHTHTHCLISSHPLAACRFLSILYT